MFNLGYRFGACTPFRKLYLCLQINKRIMASLCIDTWNLSMMATNSSAMAICGVLPRASNHRPDHFGQFQFQFPVLTTLIRKANIIGSKWAVFKCGHYNLQYFSINSQFEVPFCLISSRLVIETIAHFFNRLNWLMGTKAKYAFSVSEPPSPDFVLFLVTDRKLGTIIGKERERCECVADNSFPAISHNSQHCYEGCLFCECQWITFS